MTLNWNKSSASVNVMSVCFIGSDSLFFRRLYLMNFAAQFLFKCWCKVLSSIVPILKCMKYGLHEGHL